MGDDGIRANSGAAYVFAKPATRWANATETAKLTAPDGASGDEFGNSVSVSGDTVVPGAFWDDHNGDSNGSAYVFVKPATVWTDATQTVMFIPSDSSTGD